MTNHEDPDLDFTKYMERQKDTLSATVNEDGQSSVETPKRSITFIARGIIFFAILLLLLGVLIYLYAARPQSGSIHAPDGYRIDTEHGAPRLEKIK